MGAFLDESNQTPWNCVPAAKHEHIRASKQAPSWRGEYGLCWHWHRIWVLSGKWSKLNRYVASIDSIITFTALLQNSDTLFIRCQPRLIKANQTCKRPKPDITPANAPHLDTRVIETCPIHMVTAYGALLRETMWSAMASRNATRGKDLCEDKVQGHIWFAPEAILSGPIPTCMLPVGVPDDAWVR